jgi:hypothetical protein
MSQKPTSTYQLKITLRYIQPPVWRRVLVPGDITLAKLHHVIQETIGWTNSHLHMFRINGQLYSAPSPYDPGHLAELRAKSTVRAKLGKLVDTEDETFIYEYDFGDGWEHAIVVEKILPSDEDKSLPVCLDGERACPPEDIGGVPGYENFIETMQDANHPEHEMYAGWLESINDTRTFDPEAFDVDEVNRRLKQI